MRLRVVHIASADLWGGAESQLLAVAREMSRRSDVEVAVLLLNRRSRLAQQLIASNITVHELDETSSGAVALLIAVIRYLKQFGADVLHTHRFKENILGALAARWLQIPSVRTMHGAPEPEMLGRGLRRRILGFLDDWIARRMQFAVAAVSGDLAEKLRRSGFGARVSVVRNGVSVEDIWNSSREQVAALPSANTDACRVGYFGRLVPVKRVDLFLESAATLQQASGKDYEFYVVGEGPDRIDLEKRAVDLTLSDRVHFMGFQPHAAALIRQMDIVALTSDHEGLPMVLLEALSLGVPVVSRAVGGIPEIFQSGAAGELVYSNNPAEFGRAIGRLADSIGGSRNRMQRPVLLPNEFSIETTVRNYIELYELAISSQEKWFKHLKSNNHP